MMIYRPYMTNAIVIVEDYLLHRKLYASIILASGYTPIPVDDERETVDIVARVQPNLLIVDIRLPRVDGRQLITKIRQDERVATTPILAVSALGDPDLADTCLAAGANEFYRKPVPLFALMAAFSKLARRK